MARCRRKEYVEYSINLPLLAVSLAGLPAVIIDIRTRTIPNWICLFLGAFGLVWNTAQQGLTGLGIASLGAMAGFAVFFVFYWLGGMGGGDIKLMSGCGAVLGVPALFEAAFLTALIGGVLAVLACLKFWRRPEHQSIPYGPAIVAGVWLTVWARSAQY